VTLSPEITEVNAGGRVSWLFGRPGLPASLRSSVEIKDMKTSNASRIEWINPLHANCIAVLAEFNGAVFASGSGFVLNFHYAVTAAHVVEDFERRLNESGLRSRANGPAPFSMQIAQLVGGKNALFFWDVIKVSICQVSDIAILHLKATTKGMDEYEWNFPTLQLIPPNVGDRISAVGFEKPQAKKIGHTTEWHLTPVLNYGEVTELYNEKRDSLRMPFPSFRTNAKFEASMSGGPVFTQEGKVCGIVCSSFTGADPDDCPISFATTLWPMMGMEMDLPSGNSRKLSVPLLTLAHTGYIKADGYQNISLKMLNSKVQSCSISILEKS
jgi:hypothetical protein